MQSSRFCFFHGYRAPRRTNGNHDHHPAPCAPLPLVQRMRYIAGTSRISEISGRSTRMFTGIITGIGQITHVQPLGDSAAHGKRLQLQAPAGYLDDVENGDSIALNGACMTVTSFDRAASTFTIDVSAESLQRTTGLSTPGIVNLEKALRANDRLGGHIVSGHVDGIGTVSALSTQGESHLLQIAVPTELAAFMTYKGSITINGVSLTINQVEDAPAACTISINLIPHTMQHTTLHTLRSGSPVNLEIDMLARYVQRALALRDGLPGTAG